MGDKILKNWSGDTNESVLRKIGEKVKRGPPLRERVSHTIYRLKQQSERLDQAASRMQRHDRELFEKCVAAELAKDTARAAMYANETAEVRKMAKIILFSHLAIEQVILRMETIEEFGDVLTDMAPISGVIHTLKGKLSGIIPEVSYELGSIGEMMNGMMIEAGEASGSRMEISTEGEASRNILKEASLVAEQRMKDRFPDLPAAYHATETEREKPNI